MVGGARQITRGAIVGLGLTISVTACSSAAPTPDAQYSSDHDAVTVLASTATEVVIVTLVGTSQVNTDAVLQDDPNKVYYDTPQPFEMGTLLAGPPINGSIGTSYVVFFSYWRGGNCLSAVFEYNAKAEQATLIRSNDGTSTNKIKLKSRTLTVPHKLSLAQIRARMNPRGGPLYPADAREENCPGP